MRHIGIGGIAMAGIIGILRSSKIIGNAIKLAYNEIFHRHGQENGNQVRTQADLSMLFIVTAILLTALLIFVFFYGGVVFNVTEPGAIERVVRGEGRSTRVVPSAA